MQATRRPRISRLPAAALMLLLGALLVLAPGAPQLAPLAHAAPGDSISEFDISYTVNTDGSVSATETITYNFAGSNRHGIYRQLVSREPYGNDEQDAVYDYSDIRVSSPTGASANYTTSTLGEGSRNEKLQLQIGSQNQTVDSTETYVINYKVTGAMRTSGDYDEFYWDTTGFDSDAPIDNATVSVEVPGGAQEVSCFTGPPGRNQTTECTSKTISNEVAEFSQSDIADGSGLTVGVKINPGLVANPNPTLVPNAEQEAKDKQTRNTIIGAGAAGLSAIFAPLLGWLYWRRRGRDERFVGVPPGTIPPAGSNAPVALQQGKVTIPVAFSPPRIPVGEAGMVKDGVVDIADTTATLIDLATRGALTLSPEGESSKVYVATLRDPSVATAPHEVAMLNELFEGRPPGAVASLGDRGTLTDAHDATTRELRKQVRAQGWFTQMPKNIAVGKKSRVPGGLFGILIMAWVVMGNAVVWSVIGGIWPLLLAVIPIVITMLVVRRKLRRGQRTAVGRAVTDQIEGFRTYLATAEADQLKFEEGEDIFSKYLPWAIIFGLTERWAKLCGELIAAGRIPNVAPGWYYGDFTTFNILALNSTLSTAATPMPAPSAGGGSGWSSGAGFGGGSSFGGGGFSGGGGGGGGVGSW
ncbi:DUF2207 domain-containing protein [Enemella evansiae]|uniref:DUF2207 domain-containing protein n=1 Tax=Enemella evansiae TaxID=2016499 RepID=UPI00117F3B3C|nr:DUF2207 domain-containing protein [Enemella evansiae]